MNISLTQDLEQYVHDKVNSGLYTSASEVIRESLRLMHTYDSLQKQQIKELNKAIAIGMAELDRGYGIAGEKSRTKMKHTLEQFKQGKE